jgi:hypothetical protein
MKAVALLVAFVGVIMFINAPVETTEQTADSLGISPMMLVGAIGVIILFFLIRGSRTPRG